MKTYAKELIAELDRHGIPARLEMQSRGHPRIYFEKNGREQFYVIAGSASDGVHGLQNALSGIRKLAGIKRAKPTIAKPRRRYVSRKRSTTSELPSITVKDDAREALLGALTKDELAKRADHAWRDLWRDSCKTVTGHPSIAIAFAAGRL